MSGDDYRAAVDLLDYGIRTNAKAYTDLGSSKWKAIIPPVEHAELALRLAQALAAEARA